MFTQAPRLCLRRRGLDALQFSQARFADWRNFEQAFWLRESLAQELR